MKKIVIFGYNRLSIEAMSRLDLSVYQLVIVEHDEKQIEQAKEHQVDISCINFQSDDDLRAIGVGSDVAIIFCFFPNDANNVFLTLSARALDKNLHIIAIVENQGAAEKLLAAGANKIIDPYEICGRKIHELIKKPDMTNILDHTVFGRHDLNMAEIKISKGCSLENSLLCKLNIDETANLILIGIVSKEHKDTLHFSLAEKKHKINAGDILVVMGPSRDIKLFKKNIE
ncbi:MAG: NAD-binding protein [Methylococcales bacterium]|nr:NAD-binding protein [Methylococcales bacterium]